MSMMKSFALSRLAQQRLLLGSKFLHRNAHDWLVWEPGAWSVPRGNISVAETVPPKQTPVPVPAKGDPLCFALTDTVTVGRSEGNDLILSDETVSRHHCSFTPRDGGWVVSKHTEAKELKVDGGLVAESVRLTNGQRVQLGQVVLTFLSAQGMVERLQKTSG